MVLRAGFLALALALPAPAGACRLALALGLDVSASVDPDDYALQAEGLARALTDPEVARIILADPADPVLLAVFEWSGTGEQAMVLNWTRLDRPAALQTAAAVVRAHGRSDFLGKTSIGSALQFAARLMASAPDCAARTLDISGDGKNNEGPEPGDVYASGAFAGITVNALAVGKEIPIDMPGDPTVEDTLDLYFAKEIIFGPAAFVENTLDYTGYGRAMKRKLLREVGGMIIGSLK